LSLKFIEKFDTSKKAHRISSIYGTTKQTAEKLSLEGHGFSRATIMIKNSRALAPEVRFFTILLRDPLKKNRTSAAKSRVAHDTFVARLNPCPSRMSFSAVCKAVR
jgi:hypothetical protein